MAGAAGVTERVRGLDQRSLLLRCGGSRCYWQVIECQLQNIKIAQAACGDVLQSLVEQQWHSLLGQATM